MSQEMVNTPIVEMAASHEQEMTDDVYVKVERLQIENGAVHLKPLMIEDIGIDVPASIFIDNIKSGAEELAINSSEGAVTAEEPQQNKIDIHVMMSTKMIVDLQEELNGYKVTNFQLNSQIAQLQEESNNLKLGNSLLKDQFNGLKESNSQLEEANSELNGQSNDLNDENTQLKEKLNRFNAIETNSQQLLELLQEMTQQNQRQVSSGLQFIFYI